MTEERVTFQNLGDSALKAQIEIKATPEKVYASWTEPERFKKWFGPRSGSLIVDRFDPLADGGYDVTMAFSDGDRARMTGRYLVLDPPRKIVFTWSWNEGAEISEETLVTVEIAPSPKGALLTLTHERFLSAAARNNHEQGWGPLLVRLDSSLAEEEA